MCQSEKLGQSPEDAFIFNGDNVFNATRIGGPTVPIVQNNRDEGNGLVGWGSWHPGACTSPLQMVASGVSLNSPITETLGNFCNRHDGKAVTHSE